MSGAPLVIFDTNVLVSAALGPHSLPAQVFDAVLRRGHFAICEQSVAELGVVLSREKLDRFATLERRMALLDLVKSGGIAFTVQLSEIQAVSGACRDPDDELFLALALAASAEVIVSGDVDLLTLTPWRGITICPPAQYLAQVT